MDEQKLRKILQDQEVPSTDVNAKKRAVNLAVAEFKAHQNEAKKSFQGMSVWARLTSKTTQQRRDPMEQAPKKKMVYGGMATAMAVVLIAGVTVSQFQNFGTEQGASDLAVAQLSKVQFNAAEITAPPGTEEAAPAYVTAVKEQNEARTEEAERAGSSSLPTPMEPLSDVAGEKDEAVKQDMYATAAADAVAPQPMVAPTAPPMARERAAQKSKMSAMGFAGAGAAIGNMVASTETAVPQFMPFPYPEPGNPYYQEQGRDQFEEVKDNPVKVVAQEPVSTFSTDVDTASYSFVRRMINQGTLPDRDVVRIEEMVNYFDYNYAGPDSKEQPFKANVSVTKDPWAEGKQLIHIGIKGYDVGTERPHSNLVFLIDVSGSMDSPDKLPLVKSSMKLLLESLRPDDTVAIVVYAGAAGQVLEPTKVSDKQKIINALDSLTPGGSTAGAQGIELAYQLAEKNFNKEGVNRVILASDGDFNVGISDPGALKEFVAQKRKSGIFLSVLGFGQGNLNDQITQTLAQSGNGTAAYIDTLNEARKVLVEEASSTLFPIAKDVKIQVEFNPAKVAEYRLVGYETRHLNREDFNNDAVDAGDIGAGHTVTAIYEITPVGGPTTVDPLRYGNAKPAEVKVDPNFSGEIAFLKIRYKLPEESTSKLITTPITANMTGSSAVDVGWAQAVAGFGQLLKGNTSIGNFSYDDVVALAEANKGEDKFGYRAEFINMARLAKTLASSQGTGVVPVSPQPMPPQPQPYPLPLE